MESVRCTVPTVRSADSGIRSADAEVSSARSLPLAGRFAGTQDREQINAVRNLDGRRERDPQIAPPYLNMIMLNSGHLRSARCQLNSSHRGSIPDRRLFVLSMAARGARSGDGWILSWARGGLLAGAHTPFLFARVSECASQAGDLNVNFLSILRGRYNHVAIPVSCNGIGYRSHVSA
jgi:hypothetical protein